MAIKSGFGGMIGHSPQMLELFELISCVAEDGESTVLIQGQSGTGKELIARAIHEKSQRNTAHFVPVNCAAIPDELLESELFGYVKGAFTGAQQSKIGRVQFADGGTLFLDEIGDMKPSLQAKLLRVLQEREVEQVGGVKPTKVDVRVIAATHQNLEELVASGQFREDLYYRLAVIPLIAPPLCERKDDIVLLIESFIEHFSRRKDDRRTTIDPVAMKSLLNYSWPGNVRELENLMQRLVILHRGKRISLKELPEKYRCVASEEIELAERREGQSSPSLNPPEAEWSEDGLDFNSLISEFEDRLILQALSRTGGNKKEAARMLNLKRTTLIEKIKKKNLPI
ncbi:regulatory protein, Fis family [Desulfuromusa kysingii]|uniref:Regulatory protein, Fis family n=1 Tax=Desulfuromusa kysingii TaxID=37625 RepID=A0A1H4CQ49_9BACT|nr:sigma-54 dependent transcriptional regulator [Desulfuromusa kysingii]SEA62480.1 regulatory protein, Fis family [Desulfuromusa kysingii]